MNFIATANDHEDLQGIKHQYQSMGVTNIKVLRLIGVLTGIYEGSLEELKISGVMSVEEDRKLNISIMSPERHFSKLEYKDIAKALKEKANKFPFKGDISDLGNEIGIVIGELYENLNTEEIGDIVSGLRHGISLTNGTH